MRLAPIALKQVLLGVTIAAHVGSLHAAEPDQRVIPWKSENKGKGERQLRSAESLWLRDFSKVAPGDAVSATPRAGQWLLRDFRGQPVLYADGSHQLPPLTYPVGSKGLHDVYVGLYTLGSPIDDAEWKGVHLKLKSDAWYTHIYGGRTGLGHGWELGSVDEFFWRRASLTDEDILIYQPHGRFFKPNGGIAYVRLVPVSDARAETDLLRDQRSLRESPERRVVGMADFWSWVMVTRRTDVAGTEAVVDNHKAAGFDNIFFQINADGQVHYHSKVAQWVDQKANQDPRTEMGEAAAAVLRDHDPLKVASERAHQQGLRFFAWFRLTNEQSINNDRIDYMRNFRHLRVHGADDRPTRWPSLSHPEIQAYKLAILREVVTNYPQVNGLLLDFLRTMPVIGYDAPAVEAYIRAYGVNPLQDVSERASTRWKQFRADYVTCFVRAVREIADDEGKRTGRRILLATRVTPRDNLWKGLDVRRWVREGLIDILIPSNYSKFNPPFPITEFIEMTRGTACEVYTCINPFFAGGADDSEHHPNRHEKEVAAIVYRRVKEGCPTNREYIERVLDQYAQGAHGVVFYESETLTSPTRLYPARAGMLPMFRACSKSTDALTYLRNLPPD